MLHPEAGISLHEVLKRFQRHWLAFYRIGIINGVKVPPLWTIFRSKIYPVLVDTFRYLAIPDFNGHYF